VSYVAYASVTDDDRRQRPLLVWPPTLCVGGPIITYEQCQITDDLHDVMHFYNFAAKSKCGQYCWHRTFHYIVIYRSSCWSPLLTALMVEAEQPVQSV